MPRLALAGLVALGLQGCAEERDPINRVQSQALAKSFFVGDLSTSEDDPEFYTATTIVDVPYGADSGGPFAGLVGDLRRIKWEITETHLLARLTYETVDGVDGHGSRTTNNGQVVASYAIDGHFDIQRSYNPSTGEESNVVEENVTDKLWHERAFFRVDWSQNQVTSSIEWDPLASTNYQFEPLAYNVTDPDSPDAPKFEGKQGYFDITNKIHVKPAMLNLNGTVNPACYYRGSLVIGGTAPWGKCENSEITVRHSFKRMAQPGQPGASDFEPIDWDGSRMNALGVFVVSRLGWDRQYGLVDEKHRRFAQKYNIWQKSHAEVACATPESYALALDPQRDEDRNGTADECETAGAGSRCNELSGKCTIPYAQRELRPVAWHYTQPSADDPTIFDSSEAATWQWDVAMRIAVQAARRVECVRTGTASLAGTAWEWGMAVGADEATVKTNCATAFPINAQDDVEATAVADVNRCVKSGQRRDACLAGVDPNSVAAMRPMVVICANPVAETDDAACGKRGTRVRAGDIRYHQLNVWPTRMNAAPWGYGPSLADPLTGEIVSAGINIYNATTDSAAQSFLDQIRWINGELSLAELTNAEHVRDWVGSQAAEQQLAGPLLTREEISHRMAGLAGVDPAEFQASLDELQANPAKLRDLRQGMERMARELHDERLPPDAIPEDRSEFDARIEMAKGSSVEAELINPMWLQMAAVPPDASADVKLEAASPLRGMSSTTMRLEEQHVHRALAEKGQCMLGAPEPTGIPALSKVMQRKFPYDPALTGTAKNERLERMWSYLRGKMNYNVILHEMGHTIGLRHNFVSSYDRFNFKPQYWQLRTRGGTVTEPCDGPTADGASCIGPRYHDPLDQDEIDQSVWTWQQTTVMDYAGDLTQDMLGLGVYDYAATRMFYGDVVDVDDDPAHHESTPEGIAVVGLVDRIGSVFGQTLSFEGSPHYSQWNKIFGLIRNCQPVTPTPPAWWDVATQGEWDPVFDGHIVRNEVCQRPPVDYVAWADMVPDEVTDPLEVNSIVPRRARDAKGRPRMPYGFESDEYADGWSPAGYRHDNGADMYEELMFHSSLYENRHIFDSYRNGRVNFAIYSAYQRALSRYHTKIANLTQGFAYTTDFILRDFAKNSGFSFATALAANIGEGGFLYDHAVAASVGFDHFTRVMTRPHIGGHYKPAWSTNVLDPTDDVITGFDLDAQTVVHVPNGNSIAGGELSFGGRGVNNEFQYNQGYWTIDYIDHAGSYYEKTFAIERMFEASYGAINFYRFDGIDARFRHINYADLFPEGMRRFVGLTLTDDHAAFAPRLASKNGTVETVSECPLPGGECVAAEMLKYPAKPMAWVSFVPADGPEACAPEHGILACSDAAGGRIVNGSPSEAMIVNPQLGYEVQKFIVFWSYVYQPASETLDWVDMMRVFQLGGDSNPDYLPDQVVEWRDPESGLRYLAKRYGDETIFGKTYDRGIAAKMIQWANHLTSKAYRLDADVPFDPVTGMANVLYDEDGQPIVANDPAIPTAAPTCNDNTFCVQLRKYRGLLDYTRSTAAHLGFPEPGLQIIGG
jgi:hypothetical protein